MTKASSNAAQRNRELGSMKRMITKHEVFSTKFLSHSLRLHQKNKTLIDKIGSLMILQRIAMNKELHAVAEPEKKEKVREKYGKIFKRMERISTSWKSGPKLSVPATDEVFLRKIKVPKPLSGYMTFAKDNREAIRVQNPELNFGEIGKKIGEEWRKLSKDEKKNWTDKGMQIYEKVKQENAAFIEEISTSE
jgi:hypothetical protein